MNISALLKILFAFGLLGIFAAQSCQSTGPTGSPIGRTEPEKTAESLRQASSGSLTTRELVTRFGKEITFRHCRLTIPKDTFSSDTHVTIAFPSGVAGGFLKESAYALAPDALELRKPALLSIHYFDDDLEAGQDERDIELVKLIGGQWFPVGDFTLDIFNNIVSTTITRLETYALMVSRPRKSLINRLPEAHIAYEIRPLEAAPGENADKAAVAASEKGKDASALTEQANAAEGANSADAAPPEKPARSERAGKGSPSEGVAPIVPAEPAPIGEESTEAAKPSAVGRTVEPEDTQKKKRDSYIIDTPPAPEKPKPALGARVRYSGGESIDPDGKLSRYMWDLDADGNIDHVSSSPDVIKRYETYGSLLAILQVEDNERPAGKDLAFATPELPKDKLAPKLPFTASAVAFPREVVAGGKVVLGASVTGGEPPYKYSWSFSDGTTANKPAVLLFAGRPGEIRGSLTVTDSSGRSISREVLASVITPKSAADGAPAILIEPGRVYLDVPGKVSFKATIKGAREPYTLLVDPSFGEPFAVKEDAFSVNFANAGYYVMTVTLTDRAGRGAKYFVPVLVTPGESGVSGAPAAARISFALDYGKDGAITFRAAGIERSRLRWEFGDGTASEESKPQKSYAKPGEYLVTLTADNGVERRTVQRNIAYGGGKLVAAIDSTPTLRVMAPYRLAPRAVVAGGRMPLFFRWKLGDKFSEEESPEFSISEGGTYQLQLKVGDADGNTYDTDPVILEVSRTPKRFRYPIAYFQAREEGGVDVKLAEFDRSSEYTFTLGPKAPTAVTLAPQGTGIALLDGTGFESFDLAGGRKTMSFTPSTGSVSEVFLTSSPDLLAFNVSAGGVKRGYIRSQASGILLISDRNERVLDITPDGSSVLLASDKEVRMMRVDSFTGGLSSPAGLGSSALEGRLTSDASRAFIIAANNDVYSADTASGQRSRLTDDGRPKSNLSVSDNGATIAYAPGGNGIVLISPQGGKPGMPVDLSQVIGFSPSQWVMSPDGRLVLAYGKQGDKQGLFMLNLAVDLGVAAASELIPSFFAESTPVFAMSGDKRYFDVLLGQGEPAMLELTTAP